MVKVKDKKYIGRNKHICATEDFGMPCWFARYDSAREVYVCADTDGHTECANRLLDPNQDAGEE